MKKIICLVLMLILISSAVYAGSIDVETLHNDDAQLFVGTVENYTTVKSPHTLAVFVDTAVVTPVYKIKGDVEIGVAKTYGGCHFETMPEKDTEYLFIYFNENNFYQLEIESRDNDKIKLKNAYGMTKNIENWINDGTYDRAEEERINRINQAKAEELKEDKTYENKLPLVWCICGVAVVFIFIIILLKKRR